MVIELSHEEARGTCVHKFAQCTSSEDLPPLKEIIGQDRALRALKFGLQIQDKGFNIYVAGMPGTGRKTAIINFLEEIAKDRPVPNDWCYVNNFQDSNKPNALKLPAGKGIEFKRDMDGFVSEVRKSVSTAFESDEYRQRRVETLKTLEDERDAVTKQVNSMAANAGFLLQRSPIGLLLVPIVDGRPINEQEFAQLPPNVQAEIQERRESLQERLRGYIRQFRDLEKKADEAVKELNRSVATFALEPIFSTLREKFSDCGEVLIFLGEVSEDILNNLPDILRRDQEQQKQPQLPFMPTMTRRDPTDRYKVNLLVDNSKHKGAPVVMELNPTYARLFGGTEKEARFGALVTNYTMITGGSAHRANRMGFMLTKSLRPEPIPFDAKVVLVGNPQVYQVLYTMDRDFKELFKVKADFDTTMDRDEENVMQYASFMCTLCNKEALLHIEPQGMAAVVEYSSRLASDKSKLSTQFAEVSDIIREANFYAREDGAALITRQHVQKALEEKVYRSNLIEKKIDEMITRNVLLIETEGEKVGQVNGLAVLSLGDYGFGKPSRITASVGVGKKGIIDIEREAQMGGPTHTKGVLIISGFLNDRFASDEPLSLTARLVFEQSYSGVDGDSASSTELYSLLSALSGKPIRQRCRQ
jgi:predicted ATP-dependent protease